MEADQDTNETRTDYALPLASASSSSAREGMASATTTTTTTTTTLTTPTPATAEGRDPLTELVLQFGDVALGLVTKHLGAQDALSLQAVSRPWCNLLRDNEEEIFKKYLRDDFPEGGLLIDIVEGRVVANPSNEEEPGEQAPGAPATVGHKRMYLAFRRRFRLQTTPENRVCMHWRKPGEAKMQSDVRALVFIARVGDHCAEMKWQRYYENNPPEGDNLLLKTPAEFGFSIEREKISGELNDEHGWAREDVGRLFPVTLHCVDVERCSVMSIMEDELPSEFEQDRSESDEEVLCIGHYGSSHLSNRNSPSFFGFPQDKSLNVDWALHRVETLDIEWCQCLGYLELSPRTKGGDTFHIKDSEGLYFSFDHHGGWTPGPGLTFRTGICSILRAAMEEMCH